MNHLCKLKQKGRTLKILRVAYRYYQRTRAFIRYIRFRKKESSKLLKFRNKHSGQRCFIVGNGPSINKQDLTLLRDEFTFATNSFALHDKFEQINISYYCVSDPLFWRRKGGVPRSIYEKLLKQSDMILFLEQTGRVLGNLFAQGRVFYMFLDYYHKVRDGYVSLDISKRTYYGHTVIIDFCIPLAYYMGFKEIYLLGCDCDYSLNEAPDFSKAYFYSGDKKSQEEVSNDTARIVAEAQEWIFSGYRVIKSTLEKENVKIYNATEGGRLEVFDRVRFEDII
jgi:uncharacterized Rossmann fold enzyme